MNRLSEETTDPLQLPHPGKKKGIARRPSPPEAFRTIPCPTYHPDFSNCCATIGFHDKRALMSTSPHYALFIFLPHHLLKALRTAFFFAADMPLATTPRPPRVHRAHRHPPMRERRLWKQNYPRIRTRRNPAGNKRSMLWPQPLKAGASRHGTFLRPLASGTPPSLIPVQYTDPANSGIRETGQRKRVEAQLMTGSTMKRVVAPKHRVSVGNISTGTGV